MALVQRHYGFSTGNQLDGTVFNSLANNALVLYPNDGGFFDNTGAYPLADIELAVQFTVAPAANSAILVWLLQSLDLSTWEDGGVGITPARSPDLTFPVRAVTTLQRVTKRVVLPAGYYRILMKNDATGTSFVGTGVNTLTIRQATVQSVSE